MCVYVTAPWWVLGRVLPAFRGCAYLARHVLGTVSGYVWVGVHALSGGSPSCSTHLPLSLACTPARAQVLSLPPGRRQGGWPPCRLCGSEVLLCEPGRLRGTCWQRFGVGRTQASCSVCTASVRPIWADVPTTCCIFRWSCLPALACRLGSATPYRCVGSPFQCRSLGSFWTSGRCPRSCSSAAAPRLRGWRARRSTARPAGWPRPYGSICWGRLQLRAPSAQSTAGIGTAPAKRGSKGGQQAQVSGDCVLLQQLPGGGDEQAAVARAGSRRRTS